MTLWETSDPQGECKSFKNPLFDWKCYILRCYSNVNLNFVVGGLLLNDLIYKKYVISYIRFY